MPNRTGKQVNFWMPTELWNRMDQRARDLGMTRTTYMIRTIEHELQTAFLSEVIAGRTTEEDAIDLEATLISLRADLERLIEDKIREAVLNQESRTPQGETATPTTSPQAVTGRAAPTGSQSSALSTRVKKDIDKYIYTLNPKSRESVRRTYKALLQLGGTATRKEIAQQMGAQSENSIRRPLNRLLQDGWISVHKQGRTYIYQCI